MDGPEPPARPDANAQALAQRRSARETVFRYPSAHRSSRRPCPDLRPPDPAIAGGFAAAELLGVVVDLTMIVALHVYVASEVVHLLPDGQIPERDAAPSVSGVP